MFHRHLKSRNKKVKNIEGGKFNLLTVDSLSLPGVNAEGFIIRILGDLETYQSNWFYVYNNKK